MCLECSKDLSHLDSSFEHLQHVPALNFRLRNKKNIFNYPLFLEACKSMTILLQYKCEQFILSAVFLEGLSPKHFAMYKLLVL